MEPFYIRIAELTVQMNATSPEVKEFCKDYLVPAATADIIAQCTPEEVTAEQALGENISTEAAESLCLYRSIAEQLPHFQAVVFHGAAISYADGGYLFTAPSGTGKSTHIKLWRKYLGKNVDIINGDKPILRVTDEGVLVCSTPWAGKERWQKNRRLPLRGLCLLTRGPIDRIAAVTPASLLDALLSQVYLPTNGDALAKTLDLLDAVCKTTPLYRLECTPTEAAVKAAFPAMTGQSYPQKEGSQ